MPNFRITYPPFSGHTYSTLYFQFQPLSWKSHWGPSMVPKKVCDIIWNQQPEMNGAIDYVPSVGENPC